MNLCECGSDELICPKCGAHYRNANEIVKKQRIQKPSASVSPNPTDLKIEDWEL